MAGIKLRFDELRCCAVVVAKLSLRRWLPGETRPAVSVYLSLFLALSWTLAVLELGR